MMMRTYWGAVAIAALTLSFGCGGGGTPTAETEKKAEPAAVTKVDPATAATVTGKVSFSGSAPKPARIDMSAEPDCKGLHTTPAASEEVVVNSNGTLANVFVWVKGGLEGKTFEPAASPAMLDQKGCIYRPHVLGVRSGQTISIANSDPTTHNVHPLPKINREWNQSQPPKGANLEKSFPRQEVMVAVKCNVHPWMKSYIGVVDHPFFAVTGDQGTFEIKGLPPGEYVVEAWHEKYGTQEQKVTLAASASQTLDFAFKGE
jgi:plastocyanin